MSCYSCGGNPKTFCSECLASKDTWIAPVDVLPDPFLGDYDHLYRTPDGNLYALSPDRAEWIRVNGQGRIYKGGNGISIGDDGVINNTKPNRDQTLSIDGRTITITHGNSIELPPDNDTLYNDAELRQRIQTLENRTDNFVTGVNVSRDGNRVKLTYTFRNSPTKEVEFEDKDTVALAYDDTPLKQRIQRLEDKPDKDTIYDDKPLRDRIEALENKPVGSTQDLRFKENTRELSITGGNSVTLPNDKQTLAYNGKEMSISDGNTVPMETAYNILEEPHGRGLVGAYNKDTKNNYWVSQPYLFFGRKTLRELGFNVGDKLNFNLFDVFSTFTSIPENSVIRAEFYTTNGMGNTLGEYLGVFNSFQNLTNHGNYEATATLTEKQLNSNSIILRVDRFSETNHRLSIKHLQVYGGNYIVNKKLPYSMETFKDEINYLPNTLSLDGWTVNGNKGDYQGVASATFTRPANDSESQRDLLTITTSYQLNPGWYTVGFYAFASKPSPISCYAFDPNISYVTVNSQDFYGYYGDSANVFNLTKENDFYWFSFYIPNVTHSKVKIVLGRQNTDASKGATITIHRPFLVKGTPNRGYVPDTNEFMEVRQALQVLLTNLKDSGAWNQTGSTIFQGSLNTGRNIATGNINIFGGTPDGNSFVRTNNGSTDNDLAGG